MYPILFAIPLASEDLLNRLEVVCNRSETASKAECVSLALGLSARLCADWRDHHIVLRSLSQNPGKEPWPHNSSENMSSARAYSDPNSSTLLPTSSVSLGSTYPTSTPLDATPNRHTFVYIEILPNGSPTPCTTSTFMCNMSGVNEQASKPALFSNGITDVFRPSCHPRPICSINPTITLLSRSEISAKSYCLAVLDGVPVYEESTELDIASSESCADAKSALLYSVKLLPGYWETICLCPGTPVFSKDMVELMTYRCRSYSIQNYPKDNASLNGTNG